jgi:hypothetical protein
MLATAVITEALKLKVKKWSLKNMAQQFNNYKKKLYNNYQEEDTSRIYWPTREATGSLGSISAIQGIKSS